MGRVNLKCDTETRERLREYKRDGETWDEYLNRLGDYAAVVEQ